jgi:hypothetical protein
LYGNSSVDVREFPAIISSDKDLLKLTDSLIEFNSEVWKTKKDSGISLNTEISDIIIPEELEVLTTSLNRMHRIT